jgi:hypothetical protein
MIAVTKVVTSVGAVQIPDMGMKDTALGDVVGRAFVASAQNAAGATQTANALNTKQKGIGGSLAYAEAPKTAMTPPTSPNVKSTDKQNAVS